MFAFLHPVFLWAALAALVPLVLHLMQKRRAVRLPFSTIRFLKLARERSANRLRMENLLLWLLRTALVLALALAFAMPLVRGRRAGDLLGRAARDVAIVLDGSYSMRYSTRRGSVWELAVETALEIVNGMQEGDQVSLFVARDTVEPLIETLTADRELARSLLKRAGPGLGGSRLLPAVEAARESLRRETRRRARELHVLTDGQAVPWRDAAGAGGRAEERGVGPDGADRSASVFVALLGVAAPQNVAPYAVRIEPGWVVSGAPWRARVDIGATGGARDSHVAVFVDDAKVAERAAAVGGEAGAVAFALPPLSAGIHACRVVTPADNLAVDDTMFFVVSVRDALSCLCVGTDGDCFFLAKALSPAARPGGPRVVRAGPEDLTALDLGEFAAVFLCNAFPLSGQALLKTEQYVRAGGLAVVFPGDRAAAGDYGSWRCLEGLAPRGIATVPESERKRALRWVQPRHPILASLEGTAGAAASITISRELEWSHPHDPARVVAASAAERPFLLDQTVGHGRVLLFAVAADRSWSDFPLSPLYLPVVHQVLRFGAGLRPVPPYLVAGRNMRLDGHLPRLEDGAQMVDPNGERLSLRRSAGEKQVTISVDELTVPGIYGLLPRPTDAPAPVLAVNLDRVESDLTPVERDAVPKLLGDDRARVCRDGEELRRALEERRVGQTLGEHFLWLAFALALAELAYANGRCRSVAPLSRSMTVEPSGRVSQ